MVVAGRRRRGGLCRSPVEAVPLPFHSAARYTSTVSGVQVEVAAPVEAATIAQLSKLVKAHGKSVEVSVAVSGLTADRFAELKALDEIGVQAQIPAVRFERG